MRWCTHAQHSRWIFFCIQYKLGYAYYSVPLTFCRCISASICRAFTCNGYTKPVTKSDGRDMTAEREVLMRTS